MPTFTDSKGVRRSYLKEDELLAFANKVRKAGGGKILKALFPSTPGESDACLIANALNFDCYVTASDISDAPWVMILPENIEQKRAQKIADAVGCKLLVDDDEDASYRYPMEIVLPAKVGNTAAAFDHEAGWTRKYNDHLIAKAEVEATVQKLAKKSKKSKAKAAA